MPISADDPAAANTIPVAFQAIVSRFYVSAPYQNDSCVDRTLHEFCV
jgi:hypothetical protein